MCLQHTKLGFHRDTQPFQVSAVVALDEIPAGVGGFTLLPRSHIPVYCEYRNNLPQLARTA